MITLASIISVLAFSGVGGLLVTFTVKTYSLSMGLNLLWGVFGGLLYLFTMAPPSTENTLLTLSLLFCLLAGLASGFVLTLAAGFIKSTA